MNNIEIDFYKGTNNNVVLIITGIGGSTKGYENKYLNMAQNIVENYKYSVFVATTPTGSWKHPKENIEYITNYIHNKISKKNSHYNINVISNSAGATFMLWHAHEFKKIKKIVAINPVLNVNFHLVEKGMQQFKGDFCKVIIGEKDYSFKFTPLLNKINNIQIVTLPNIDHNFTNNLNTFIEIPNKHLFLNEII